MWIASAVLLPIGIFLTFKATTDSPLLDGDVWKRTFRKIFRRK
jgi:lipopolysaccharide export system permease protein